VSGDRPAARTAGGALGTGRSSSTARGLLPDRAAMRRWLLSEAAIGADGAVVSWANPEHPGYPYAEAAGLFLSTWCTSRSLDLDVRAAADRVAAWLCTAVAADGSVGRGGVTYLFDSAVVLAGLLRYRSVGGSVGCDATIHRLKNFVCRQISAGVAVLPRHAGADGRWSTQFGTHLVKCLHGLHLYSQAFGDPVPEDLVTTLINRSGHQSSPVYVHPFCYEQEGHLVVEHHGLASLFEPVDGALEWLAALQQPSGAILALANGMAGFGEPRTDATAQAARLWLLRDRIRYREAILRALAFLAACQTSGGGILYTPERGDVCSWATMFTLQAVEWWEERPCLDEIL
jgi:hypothetical protein